MPRLLTALAVLLAAPAFAQSSLSPSSFALGASGTYAGAVRAPQGNVGDLRAAGFSVDGTYDRVTVSVGAAFARYTSALDAAVGVHVGRNPDRLLTTTLGISLSALEDGVTVYTPSISHARRIYGRPGVDVVPGLAVGLGVVTQESRSSRQVQPLVSASVGLVIGRGPIRAVVAPSATLSSGTEVVSLGVSAGVTRGLGRR